MRPAPRRGAPTPTTLELSAEATGGPPLFLTQAPARVRVLRTERRLVAARSLPHAACCRGDLLELTYANDATSADSLACQPPAHGYAYRGHCDVDETHRDK